MVVKPETVVSWHRAGFRLYWRFLSRRGRGRRRIIPELRQLIQRLASENPTWGAPRIHGELLKLGFDVSERTVSRYLARLGRRRVLHFAATEPSHERVDLAADSRGFSGSHCTSLPDPRSKQQVRRRRNRDAQDLGSKLIRTAYRGPGKMVWRSVGSGAAAGNYWTM
ncbi:MAG TPA: helix-turn-helix domain-containing protein [Terriglobia bacterium]|nr:helix-turn-helix domain-containing protein [Terriglobia bacterium]